MVLAAELQQGFPISINVVMASVDLATPGAVCLYDQVVPWEIPSLGQGLGCTGMEKPDTDQACKNCCMLTLAFELVLWQKKPTLPRRSPISRND